MEKYEYLRDVLDSEGIVGPIGDRLEQKLIAFIRQEFLRGYYGHRHSSGELCAALIQKREVENELQA